MQNRRNWRVNAKAKKATTGTMYRSLVLRAKRGKVVPQLTDCQKEQLAKKAERKAELREEARRLAAYNSCTASEESVETLPDFRPGVEAMRARMAERFGPLMPYTHKQGWTL